jgi:hypothetical protein
MIPAGQKFTQPKFDCVLVRQTVDGILVSHGAHAWLHATPTAAVREAKELGAGFGVSVLIAVELLGDCDDFIG